MPKKYHKNELQQKKKIGLLTWCDECSKQIEPEQGSDKLNVGVAGFVMMVA
jgi:hypothetical protein